MKKSLLIITSILLATVVSGQVTNDVLRITQYPYVASASLFSQNFYEGTARTAAMGNAFISLGGDIGALTINPASSAIYKYSEFSITPSATGYVSTSDYLGNTGNSNKNNTGISSFGYVSYLNKYIKGRGNATFNVAFSVNKLNNFNSRFSASGTTNQSSWLSAAAYSADGNFSSDLQMNGTTGEYPFGLGIPWKSILAYNTYLIDPLPDSDDTYLGATENLNGDFITIAGDINQDFTRETSGGLSEFIVNVGGGIGNKLFYGINLGIQTLNYTDIQTYSESAVNPNLFNSGFDNFRHIYNQTTNGVGINAKLGLIYIPVKGLRLGATISSPTFMTITDEWRENISAEFINPSENFAKQSPLGSFTYNLVSPMRVGGGISYVFGKVAILSADIEGVAYNYMRLKDYRSSHNSFDDQGAENNTISNDFRFAKNIRFGVEIKPMPQLALRAGYSFYQSPEIASPDSKFLSIGAGINSKKGFFGDFAIIHKISQTEDLKLYADIPGMDSPTGTLNNSAYRLMLTFGFRF